MRTKKTLAAALGAAACMLAVGPAQAGNLAINEMAAALALPIVTGGYAENPLKDTQGDVLITGQTAATLVTVTNGKSDDVLLKLDMISGDRDDGDNWQSTSFECLLTGRETTTFVFTKPDQIVWGDGNSMVYVECSAPGNPTAAPTALYTNLANGILFVAVADPETGDVVSEDAIFGDAIVADMLEGQAYSFGAIAFQAGQGQNDGDKVYAFDDEEYARFPSVLATNFIAPQFDRNENEREVMAELILFTLDGTVGNLPVPRVKLGGFGYNDDEVAFDFSYEFDCFDIVALEEINSNFEFRPFAGGGLGLGSLSGHLEIVPQPIAAGGFDVHDAQYGDGNNSRKRAVHGWLVQGVDDTLVPDPDDDDDVLGIFDGAPIAGVPEIELDDKRGAWGRPLAQSTTGLLPFLEDDDATLDADVRN